jgi:hypothetical protein
LRRAAQQRLQTRKQLDHLERLGQVIVGAELQPDDLVDHLAARREHNDRRVNIALAQVAADVEAVFSGQHDVKNNCVERFARRACQPYLAVGRGLDQVAFAAQPIGESHHQARLVFDEQDTFVHSPHLTIADCRL